MKCDTYATVLEGERDEATIDQLEGDLAKREEVTILANSYWANVNWT